MRKKAGIERDMAEQVDKFVLQWFKKVERREEKRWPSKITRAELEDSQRRGTSKFGSMDGEKET